LFTIRNYVMDNLESAVQSAIAESLSSLNTLWSDVKTGLARLDAAAEVLKSQVGLEQKLSNSENQGNEAAQVAQLFIRLVSQRHQEIHDLFTNQQEYLSTFNIVLFGRTGAGKSSLIEAFACGSGTTVSCGESDWTTEVRPLRWNSCLLYDTPGIGGWGRTMSRSDLERRAQEAVEIADVVLVCFDSQSQQAGEFEKVAAWVEHYGKPVIAVFNQRNPRWRMPFSVVTRSARRNISQAVMQHTGNIRDELAKIGLVGVPIVALSSKRALFGRASEPFQGPDAATFSKHRAQHSAQQLESWSNFPA
jgi:predicted GTPase